MRVVSTVLVAAISVVAGYAIRGWLEPPAAEQARSYRTSAPVAPAPAPSPQAAQPSAEFASLRDQPTVFDTLLLAFRMAEAADIPTLQRYTAEALSYRDPLYRFNIADIFVERMNAIDVNHALDFVEGLPDSDSRRQLMTSVVATWIRKQPEAALAYVNSIPDPDLRYMIASVIARDTTLPAEVKTAAANLAASAIEALGLRGNRVAGIVSDRASLPPDQAFYREMDETLQAIRESPATTLTDLLARTPSREREILLQSAMSELAVANPDLALEFLQDYPEELRQSEFLVLSTLAQQPSPTVIPLLEDYARRSGNVDPLATAIASLMQDDRTAALEVYGRISEPQRSYIAMQVGMAYMQDDPRGGLEWVLEQPLDPSMLPIAFGPIDPRVEAAAEELLATLPGGEKRGRLIAAMALNRSTVDPAGAVRWLEQFRQEQGYERAYAAAMSRWASGDPAAAAERLAAEPIKPAENAFGVYQHLAYSWGQQDPQAAQAWAEGLSDPQARTKSLGSLAESMLHSDPERARELYSLMPAGAERQRVGAQLAMQQSGQDPEKMRAAMKELGIPDNVIESYITVFGQ